MPLELLKIYNARNLIDFTFSPHKKFSIVYGSNGVGKTTILESIYLLLRSRTFRSNQLKNFINHKETTCTIFSKFCVADENKFTNNFTLGISRSKNSSQPILHLNSEKINKLSIISNLVVLALITPESFSLLDEGPSVRRKFIDWGVFHVEPLFLNDWRSFKKILSNRNALLAKFSNEFKLNKRLSSHSYEQINCWSSQLNELNTNLDCYRSAQIEKIYPIFKQFIALFSDDLADNIRIEYYRGWTKDLSFNDYLKNKLAEDLNCGYTRYGTHRSELKIFYKNLIAKDTLSRGQKKIIIICLILSQFKFLSDKANNSNSILLLDDIDSELDSKNLKIFMSILSDLNGQFIITTTNKDKFIFLNSNQMEMFHVKH